MFFSEDYWKDKLKDSDDYAYYDGWESKQIRSTICDYEINKFAQHDKLISDYSVNENDEVFIIRLTWTHSTDPEHRWKSFWTKVGQPSLHNY